MKKVIIILFILMLIISVFQIGDMYAKYKIEKQGEYESLLGVWSIKLNEIDISTPEKDEEGTVITKEIELDGNLSVNTDYVAANKIAPGISGYFDLKIDPTGTDVGVIYQIKILTSGITQSQYKITSIQNLFISADGTQSITNTQASTSGTVHKGIIPLDKVNDGYINDIRVNFEWTNSDSNNNADTNLGTSGTSTITVPIEINIKQYMDGDSI